MAHRSRKVIRCISHGPLSAGKQFKTPWEDVWVTWARGKPSRGNAKAWPCLQCRPELISDIEIAKQCQANDLAKGEDASLWDDGIARSERLLAELDANGVAANTHDDLAEIVTTAHGIDRREAERMLSWWLAREYGVTNPRFKWNQASRVGLIMPMSVAKYD